jgi:hypothetical protein
VSLFDSGAPAGAAGGAGGADAFAPVAAVPLDSDAFLSKMEAEASECILMSDWISEVESRTHSELKDKLHSAADVNNGIVSKTEWKSAKSCAIIKETKMVG